MKIEIYWDEETDPDNPGWVWTDGRIARAIDCGNPSAADDVLIRCARETPLCPLNRNSWPDEGAVKINRESAAAALCREALKEGGK